MTNHYTGEGRAEWAKGLTADGKVPDPARTPMPKRKSPSRKKTEPMRDREGVVRLAFAMDEKLRKSRLQNGRSGWWDPERCSVEYLSDLLLSAVAKGDPVDVANYCMMLHARKAKITPPGGDRGGS